MNQILNNSAPSCYLKNWAWGETLLTKLPQVTPSNHLWLHASVSKKLFTPSPNSLFVIFLIQFVRLQQRYSKNLIHILCTLYRDLWMKLKLLQMHQLIQKWRDNVFPIIEPPPLTHQDKWVARRGRRSWINPPKVGKLNLP